ncbi:hypothetical protein Scep_028936 [Stephania cephalantha]|uniref:Uncharacterized protein n=1 Tax=Stephania cephalantha TaxID=152367 RepID=A0AAP0EAW8_9MAGN
MKDPDFHCALTAMKIDLAWLRSNLEAMNEVKSQDYKGVVMARYEPILRDIIYDAEDMIEESEYKFDKQNSRLVLIVKYISLLALSRESRERKERVKEIKRAIRRYREEMNTLSLELDRSLSSRQVVLENDRDHRFIIPYAALNHGDHDEVVGLESDLEKIKQWIMKPNEQLKVVGVWGMGGVGKTTLARTICEDGSVKEWFDQIMFITVSLEFDLKTVLVNMLAEKEGNRVTSLGREDDEFELVLEELHKQLNEKRYLLVLDDVWQTNERTWWKSLKSALPRNNNNNGSCVIVTTRLKEVARSMGAAEKHLHYHKTLSWNDSLSLFVKNAFPREDYLLEDEDITKKVVAKCGGLPLVIKAIAGDILKKEPCSYRWRAIAENIDEELDKSELLYYALRKSFEELPGYLKDCMLSLSIIFPEAYEISVEDAVHLWISQGLIHKTGAKTALEKGEECFDELIDKCLLLGERKDVFETRYQTCRVHNMVHHMCIKIAKEKNFMVLKEERMTLSSCSTHTRVGFIRGSKTDHFSKLGSKLRILVGREISESREFISNVKSKLLKQKWLRALDLSFTVDEVSNNIDWLHGIGSLSLLNCLKIRNSRIQVVPKTIMNLKNLQTLCLYQCCSLKKLPPEIGCLNKLTVLDVSSCASLRYLPMQIERLSNLDVLFGFRPAQRKVKGGCGMASLRKFEKLRKLWMQIDFEDQIDKNDLLVLCDLKKLEVLAITVAKNSNSSLINKLDCELPSPLEQLHHLYLHRFPGVENPQWLNPTSLPNLSFLHIDESTIRKFSKGLYGNGEKAWRLEAIVLTSLNQLEEDWTKLKTALPCLRLLKVYDCPKLKSLPCKINNGLGCWMNP